RPEEEAFATALARLFVHGVPVDWPALFDGARVRAVEVPTYPFQHRRFWPDPSHAGRDAAGLGLVPAGHALLGAAVPLADADGAVLTGRLSLATHPWLADHTVLGRTLVPGTALVELAVRAGEEYGCERVEELTLGAPLVLPAGGAVRVQVTVGAADDDGRRPVGVHSRPESAEDVPWTVHATGLLGPWGEAPAAGGEFAVWPPAGAEAVPLDGFYAERAVTGFGYGPAFQGLRAVWRRGDEVFVEAELPDGTDPRGFRLHPALFDAALQATSLLTGDGVVPFAWEGVALHAEGATAVRARLSLRGPDRVRVALADPAGQPVATADGLAVRPVTDAPLDAAAAGSPLLRVDWVPAGRAGDPCDGALAVSGDADGRFTAALRAAGFTVAADGTDAAAGIAVLPAPSPDAEVLPSLRAALTVLQEAVAAEDRPLVVVTRDGGDPAVAAVRGLLRSAAAEHPGRVAALALDDEDPVPEALRTALGLLLDAAEPEAAVRGGEALVPRLVRCAGAGGVGSVRWD
ncbi:polyketide synthase dehydratase domain-containing protein, partial [Streptomyces glaucus]|uniref:polyketide synthase dehydratase domain-containing protein n=1 Tax=Streptomyces glaucus TaxID=284029 RepID=UPI0031DF1685